MPPFSPDDWPPVPPPETIESKPSVWLIFGLFQGSLMTLFPLVFYEEAMSRSPTIRQRVQTSVPSRILLGFVCAIAAFCWPLMATVFGVWLFWHILVAVCVRFPRWGWKRIRHGGSDDEDAYNSGDECGANPDAVMGEGNASGSDEGDEEAQNEAPADIPEGAPKNVQDDAPNDRPATPPVGMNTADIELRELARVAIQYLDSFN
ncbi:hypothetical protein B0T22DRAFT_440178 [Podospora appendiculata]|uniref:Uncharacterized protein n=1 Tax=Podospora appendiculata TaxID=314037 RepID=A0AAE1CCP3_9PEZI|nr:hypothetical protein B0T22DRAFT_440178 [Podospora appendiculata]